MFVFLYSFIEIVPFEISIGLKFKSTFSRLIDNKVSCCRVLWKRSARFHCCNVKHDPLCCRVARVNQVYNSSLSRPQLTKARSQWARGPQTTTAVAEAATVAAADLTAGQTPGNSSSTQTWTLRTTETFFDWDI